MNTDELLDIIDCENYQDHAFANEMRYVALADAIDTADEEDDECVLTPRRNPTCSHLDLSPA